MFFKMGVLKKFSNFTGNYLCWSLIIKVEACNFINKRLQHRCFSVKFAEFLRTPFFTEHLRRLLLYSYIRSKHLQNILDEKL